MVARHYSNTPRPRANFAIVTDATTPRAHSARQEHRRTRGHGSPRVMLAIGADTLPVLARPSNGPIEAGADAAAAADGSALPTLAPHAGAAAAAAAAAASSKAAEVKAFAAKRDPMMSDARAGLQVARAMAHARAAQSALDAVAEKAGPPWRSALDPSLKPLILKKTRASMALPSPRLGYDQAPDVRAALLEPSPPLSPRHLAAEVSAPPGRAWFEKVVNGDDPYEEKAKALVDTRRDGAGGPRAKRTAWAASTAALDAAADLAPRAVGSPRLLASQRPLWPLHVAKARDLLSSGGSRAPRRAKTAAQAAAGGAMGAPPATAGGAYADAASLTVRAALAEPHPAQILTISPDIAPLAEAPAPAEVPADRPRSPADEAMTLSQAALDYDSAAVITSSRPTTPRADSPSRPTTPRLADITSSRPTTPRLSSEEAAAAAEVEAPPSEAPPGEAAAPPPSPAAASSPVQAEAEAAVAAKAEAERVEAERVAAAKEAEAAAAATALQSARRGQLARETMERRRAEAAAAREAEAARVAAAEAAAAAAAAQAAATLAAADLAALQGSAATRVQAMRRGQLGRDLVGERREDARRRGAEEAAAATALQSARRGHMARFEVEGRRAVARAEAAAKDGADLGAINEDDEDDDDEEEEAEEEEEEEKAEEAEVVDATEEAEAEVDADGFIAPAASLAVVVGVPASAAASDASQPALEVQVVVTHSRESTSNRAAGAAAGAVGAEPTLSTTLVSDAGQPTPGGAIRGFSVAAGGAAAEGKGAASKSAAVSGGEDSGSKAAAVVVPPLEGLSAVSMLAGSFPPTPVPAKDEAAEEAMWAPAASVLAHADRRSIDDLVPPSVPPTRPQTPPEAAAEAALLPAALVPAPAPDSPCQSDAALAKPSLHAAGLTQLGADFRAPQLRELTRSDGGDGLNLAELTDDATLQTIEALQRQRCRARGRTRDERPSLLPLLPPPVLSSCALLLCHKGRRLAS